MDITAVILAILGSSALSGFIIFLIQRHDSKKNISGRLDELEKGSLRTQLLLMLFLKPDENQKEILTVARRYFKSMGGDWYATPLFYEWCVKHNISPSWFNMEK